MTREEAIKAIKSHCYFANLVPVGKEALDMAIKALEQQPCEDSVSRQALLDSIAEIDGNTNMDIYTDEVREIINALPSVTPTRKKGKWIPRNSFLLRYKCSECNCESEKYNFCPDCGSEMENEE